MFLFYLEISVSKYSEGTLTSNEANSFCFFLRPPPEHLFWEYVRLVSRKMVYCLRAATNAHVKLITVIMTVIYLQQ